MTTTDANINIIDDAMRNMLTELEPFTTSEKIQEFIKRQVDVAINERMSMIKHMISCSVNAEIFKQIASTPPSLSSSITVRPKPIQTVQTNQKNELGKENYDYISLVNIIKKCNEMSNVMQMVITDLYFDPNHKANNIVFIPPTSYKCVTILANGVWKNFDLEPAIDHIIRRANDVMQHYFIATDDEKEATFKREITPKKYEALKEYTDKIDIMENDHEFYMQVLAATEHTIITNQHFVHKDVYDVLPDT
jgi:hypothetical protein